MLRTRRAHRRVGTPRGRVGSPTGHQQFQLLAAAVRQSPGRTQAGQEKEVQAASRRAARPSSATAAVASPEQVNHVEAPDPHAVRDGCTAPRLPALPSPGDPEPSRFQTIELPPVVAEVTEYQGHARTCPCCGHLTHAVIPAEVRAHSVGPRLTGTLSYFSPAVHGLSKRGVEEIADVVFAAPVSLGTVANLEQEVRAALAARPHGRRWRARAGRRRQARRRNQLETERGQVIAWLWAAATATVVAFVIHARRSGAGLTALLGLEIQGVVCSDRRGPYNRVPESRRQICWAHLKRDFQKVIDRGGPDEVGGSGGAETGQKGLRRVACVSGWPSHAGATGAAFGPGRPSPEPGADAKARSSATDANGGRGSARTCWTLEPAAQWTFVTTEGVEPTNNFMERQLRRAVLWRKRSFGCWSATGCRFVERILTVVQTRRLQGKSVLDYLHDAVLAHRTGQPCPSLVS